MVKLKRSHFPLILLAVILPVLILLFPYAPSSAEEEKEMAPLPSFSAEGVISGEYFDGLSDYLGDHIPFRDFWLTLQTRAKLLLQKKEINGVYILNDRLIERIESPQKGTMEVSLLAIGKFASSFLGSTFFMLVPTAEEIDSALLPSVQEFSQRELIGSAYAAAAEEGVTGIDVYSLLSANSSRYLYCRYDSRWTTGGAFYGYSAAARAMGLTPVPLDRLNVEHASHSFRGGLYHETGYSGLDPDTVDIYTYSGYSPAIRLTLYDDSGIREYPSFYFREYLDTEDCYAVFLGQDVPMAVIETDYAAGGNLLLFGDSLCDNMIPFLALHYSRITFVNLSFGNFNYRDYLDLEDYDSALFCYSVKSFAKGTGLTRVNLPPSGNERPDEK